MATSSITHNFCISSQQSVDRFIRAIDEAESSISATPLSLNGKLLTSQNDIADLMQRWTKNGK